MAGENNPFYVQPPNVLQALMTGGQGYDMGQKAMQTAATQEAGQLYAQGDVKGALAAASRGGSLQTLMGIAGLKNQQEQFGLQQQQFGEQQRHAGVTEGYTGQQLAESARHNKASEGVAMEALNKPIPLPWGGGLADRKGNVILQPGEGAMDDATTTAMAKQAIAGDASVFSNLRNPAAVMAVRKKIAELNSAGGESGAEQANRNAEFFGVKAGQRTLGTKQANIEMAATEFKQVLPVVAAASDAVSRTNYPDLNKVIQMYNEKTGDPNIVKFGGGLTTLVNLYTRATSPSGTPTVQDKEHAYEILQKAWSNGQFKAAAGMMQQEIDAALTSPQKVRDEMRSRFLGSQSGQQQATPAQAAPAQAPNIPPPPAGFVIH